MKVEFNALPQKLAGEMPTLVVIEGSEDFLRREAVELILHRVHGGEGTSENVTRLGGARQSDVDLVELFDELRTPSLFGGDRTVLLSDAQNHISREPEAWLSVLKSGWSGATLILWADKIDGRTKVGKALKKAAWVIPVSKPFNRPPPWERNSPPWKNPLNQWIVGRARRAGLQLDPPTAHLLMTRVGTSLADLAAMIERFVTVLPEKGCVDRDLVERHTPEGEESNLFELIDALFGGDRVRTLALCREILHRGSVDSNGARVTEPQGLLLQFIGSAIYRGRQVRDIHRVRAGGGGDDDIMREAGIAKFLLPRLKAQASSMSPQRLAGLFDQLFQADRDLKSGAGPRAAELLERIAVRS